MKTRSISLQDIVLILIFGLILAIFFVVVFRPTIVHKHYKISEKEAGIKGRIDSVELFNTVINQRIIQTDHEIKEYDSIFQLMQVKLDSIKKLNDCELASSFKDSIIEHDQEQKKLFRTTISQRDSVITNQRFIIHSKDTLLSIKDSLLNESLTASEKKDSKISSLKKQRNGLAIFATIEAIVIGVLSK